MNDVEIVLTKIRKHSVDPEAERAAWKANARELHSTRKRYGWYALAAAFVVALVPTLVGVVWERAGGELSTSGMLLIALVGLIAVAIGIKGMEWLTADVESLPEDFAYVPVRFALIRTMEPEVQEAIARWMANGPSDALMWRDHRLAEQWDRDLREARARADFDFLFANAGDQPAV